MDRHAPFLSHGYRLFALPTWLSGAARALDLGGTYDAYNRSTTGTEADCRAIESDWQIIGDDFRQVLMFSVAHLDPAKSMELLERLHEQPAEEGQQLRLMDA